MKRTDGIAAWPLNRLRTRLSIPFGFLHAASTHLYVSLWWRLNRFVPNILRKLSKILSSSHNSKSGGGAIVAGVNERKALRLSIFYIRFFTIFMCFFAAAIYARWQGFSIVSTSRNGRVLHTVLRCVVELTISATYKQFYYTRSWGRRVY